MREKTMKVVFTFASTADALAMEAAAREHDLPGRSIPVPSQISAGCGLAWCADVRDRNAVLEAMRQRSLAFEGVYEIAMY